MPRGVYERTKPSHFKGVKRGESPLIGTPRSEETKARISKAMEGEANHQWRGGSRRTTQGYIRIKRKDHQMATKEGYVFEHRLIMENHIGRRLNADEVVHHINNLRDDNRLTNLMLFPNQMAHRNHHIEMAKKEK